MVLAVLPNLPPSTWLTSSLPVTLLCLSTALQFLPRAVRFWPLLSGEAPNTTGLVFETGWANFVLNLVFYLVSAHVVGAVWYLFAVQVGGRSKRRGARALTEGCRCRCRCRGSYLFFYLASAHVVWAVWYPFALHVGERSKPGRC